MQVPVYSSVINYTKELNQEILTIEMVTAYDTGRYFCKYTDGSSVDDPWNQKSIYVFVNGVNGVFGCSCFT